MIDSETAQQILANTLEYWRKEAATEEFRKQASGKEIGHRIADLVEEKTTELLSNHLVTRRQYTASGKKMDRSMGDIWVYSSGLYNPVNVKAGEAGKKGQPNMVSLKKLLRALLLRHIDSYYLLIVKMILKDDIRVSVYLVDMLDYLDFVTFDSGPGQIMLKERQFYERMEDEPTDRDVARFDQSASGVKPAQLTLDEKIDKLFVMLTDGDRRLIMNREKVSAALARMRKAHDEGKGEQGEQMDQAELHLQ
ncbi:MAG TPA: hypothetical protein VH591_01200 [Ktedonobacterales bacterium]|jgi:hypothetical protein